MSNEKETLQKSGRDFGISDILVDFLGALFPGLLFSISIGLVIGSTFTYFFHQFKSIILDTNLGIENLNSYKLFQDLFNGIGYFSFYFIALLLIVSYILGQFLYRKDPKYPETASFKKIFKKMNPDQRSKWVEQILPGESISNSNFIIEFPYRFLTTYLDARGLEHLSKFVPWNAANPNTRSKTFINQLKIRIQFFYPDKMGNILKNEGHIRLMSSIWYLSRYLTIISLVCLTTNCLIFLFGLYWNYKSILFFIIPLFLSLTILFLATLGKKVIESFIHYQRVREVFYVLETAYATTITNKDILKI